jgi:energy-coupling factor transporter ATP-binding protein EcfA2
LQGRYLKRKLHQIVRECLDDFPAVAILGPRQCGKTTLAKVLASAAPQVTKGFWNSLRDLGIREAWIIAPIKEPYPIEKGVTVTPLPTFLKTAAKR